MRSFARALTAAVLVATAAFVVDLRAQTAEAVYNDVLAREGDLRREMDLAPQLRAQPPGAASAALLKRVRATVDAYEGVVRRFPRSGNSDDALWHGAVLSADAFWQFGDARDRITALRLFEFLVAQYPTSAFVKQVVTQTARLTAAEAASSPQSTLKAIRREVLPDTLRVTLELEREAAFHEERIDGPPRVFVDLKNTRAVDELKDATLAFPDDVVRQIRVGRQLDARTRVVFDLQGTARYSVYSLYNPYRLVIDFERSPASAEATAGKPATPTVATVSGAPPPPQRESAVVAASVSTPPPAPPSANSRGGFSLSRQLGLGVARVVIDPGHGGHDPGAKVKGLLSEAELVLDVSQRLEKLLVKQGVEVVLTRSADVFVPLDTRTEIANRAGADLFLSIHANASSDEAARGFETYFLSFAPNAQAEAIAARENAASAKTMRSLPEIVKAIALNNKIDESRDFASLVQASLADRLTKLDKSARSLGVKQAPFMVLIGATMPSVLAEISFLTNRQEASLLKTQSYRQQVAEALLTGVMNYQKSLKKAQTTAVLSSGF
jgi:N-acetylmuramoyl-L-alanine amidase